MNDRQHNLLATALRAIDFDRGLYDNDDQAAWALALKEWQTSGERFSAAKVLARRDEILASR